MNSKIIQDLISEFSKFPTIGSKTAARFVFYLVKQKREDVDRLMSLILKLKQSIKLCSFCFNPFEIENGKNDELCGICLSEKRNKNIVCIVEKEQDLQAIDSTGEYNGIYFILGGSINMLSKEDSKKLKREKELIERIKNPEKFGMEKISEIIIAINPTVEGEATTSYLKELLSQFDVKVSQIAKGMPSGGELEYADKDTIIESLKRRQ